MLGNVTTLEGLHVTGTEACSAHVQACGLGSSPPPPVLVAQWPRGCTIMSAVPLY